jgi:hypothetical protein
MGKFDKSFMLDKILGCKFYKNWVIIGSTLYKTLFQYDLWL